MLLEITEITIFSIFKILFILLPYFVLKDILHFRDQIILGIASSSAKSDHLLFLFLVSLPLEGLHISEFLMQVN